MKITFTSAALEEVSGRNLIVLATRDGKVVGDQPGLKQLLAPYVESGEFGKNSGDMVYVMDPEGFQFKRILFYNLGKKLKGADDLRIATAAAWKELRSKNFTETALSFAGLGRGLEQRAMLEGLILMDYKYSEFKTKKEKLPNRLEAVQIHHDDAEANLENNVHNWHVICRGTCRARDLMQMPPNVLHPESMAEIAKAWSGEHGFDIEVMDGQAIRDAGMLCMDSVGRGSEKDNRFMIMEYKPENPSGKTFCFVGKAVTFDSGGLSLKPSAGMPEMKGDMGGGAVVLGLMTVLRDAGCPHRVIGLVPAVENMPSGSATRPSDVVKTLSGKTVEINNTDAEGRLILADALTYAARFEPTYVVDFATLTGACLVALGTKIYGVMGTHQPLVDAIMAAGTDVHEPFWQLPLWEEYEDLLDSATADFSNVGSTRWGGTITAGLFLKQFADNYQWAHCDIAAAMMENAEDYYPEGGNGAGVRMAMRMMELMD